MRASLSQIRGWRGMDVDRLLRRAVNTVCVFVLLVCALVLVLVL